MRQLERGGLQAHYFDNQWLLAPASFTRVDAAVDFDWGTGLVTSDAFDYASVRWTGYLTPPLDGDYTLYVDADDGARLWLDGTLVVDKWEGAAAEPRSHPISLRRGRYHAVELE